MSSKINIENLDEQILKAVNEEKNAGILITLIGLEDKYVREIQCSIDKGEPISQHYLKQIMLARDKVALELKNCTISRVNLEDLKFGKELRNYNFEITESAEKDGYLTVMYGTDKDGKNNILYYYTDDYDDYSIVRQQRVFNEHGDIESMSRFSIASDGKIVDIDESVATYKYDNHGNKKSALIDDGIDGIVYYEYDKNGDASLYIEDRFIEQFVEENGSKYSIVEGFIDPFKNGFGQKKLPEGGVSNITIDDIRMYVSGDIAPERKNQLYKNMDSKRSEEILGILTAIEPIFESIQSTPYHLKEEKLRKMNKMVQWLDGFSKRLRIEPKLAVQDNAVMAAMKSAVHKTIGKTADAQMNLSTSAKDEKVYEGEDYGDN